MNHQAYPLTWPAGYQRSRSRSRARFKTSFARSRDGLINELRLIGASYPVISSNIPLRKDGLPYAGVSSPHDPGVACYFLWKGQQKVLASDRWDRVEDNLHAIELAVQAIRGLDRWGVSQMLDRAFAGFTALPAPQGSSDWWQVLDVSRTCSIDDVEKAYRKQIMKAHPDQGGSHEAVLRVNSARAEARKSFGLN